MLAGCNQKTPSNDKKVDEAISDDKQQEEVKELKSNEIAEDLALIDIDVNYVLEDLEYSGIPYRTVNSVKECSFIDAFTKNKALYCLKIKKNDVFYELLSGTTLIEREGKIVGRTYVRLSNYNNMYLLLKDSDLQNFLNVEPEIKFTTKNDAYLKWEAGNAYFVVYALWADGTTNWKRCKPMYAAMFKK